MITRARTLLPTPGAARALTYSTLTSSIGRGLFVTISVVFFNRSVGLPAQQVGIGLTIAAVVGLFSGIPMGILADRIGPRGIAVVAGSAAAVALLGYLFVHRFAGFVVVASLVSFMAAGSQAARGALIAGSVPPEERVRTRAYLRSVTNVGWTVGAPIAGIALAADKRAVYLAFIVVCVALYIAAALLMLRVPVVPPTAASKAEKKTAALRDRPYLTLTGLNAVLTVQYQIFNVVLPLWIVGQTKAPAWMMSILGVMNTVLIVLFQVRFSRGSATITGAARAQRNSGVMLLIVCVLYGLAADRPVWIAVAALIAGGLAQVLAELWQASGGWGLSFDLAPPHAQGQYQGLYNTGFQIAEIITPAALTALVMGLSWKGWLMAGVVFLLAGALVPIAARWAERTRPVELVEAA